MALERDPNGSNINNVIGNFDLMQRSISHLAHAAGQLGLPYANPSIAQNLDSDIEDFVSCLGLESGILAVITRLGIKTSLLAEDQQQIAIENAKLIMRNYSEQNKLPILFQFGQQIGSLLMRNYNAAQLGKLPDMVFTEVQKMQNMLQTAKITSLDHTSFSSN